MAFCARSCFPCGSGVRGVIASHAVNIKHHLDALLLTWITRSVPAFLRFPLLLVNLPYLVLLQHSCAAPVVPDASNKSSTTALAQAGFLSQLGYRGMSITEKPSCHPRVAPAGNDLASDGRNTVALDLYTGYAGYAHLHPEVLDAGWPARVCSRDTRGAGRILCTQVSRTHLAHNPSRPQAHGRRQINTIWLVSRPR